jgi:AcrR family transcriptional regulator
MNFQLRFKINEKLFIRNPEGSELGNQIVKKAIDLIYNLGFEQFTFKKLAVEMNSTEATIYRYFENKHRLLLYILNWYWCYMEFLLMMKLQNVSDKKEKLTIIIDLLTHELSESENQYDYNKKYLNQIIIAESSKSYLIKDIVAINKEEVFKPYKDLCATIANVISENNASYKFPKSLSTTLIEASHHQQFFAENLPRLTDKNAKNKTDFAAKFLSDMIFKVLGV